MNNYNFLNNIYDILAQNIDMVSKHDTDAITEMIDCVDGERNVIIFKHEDGREFELQLVQTYAPRTIKAVDFMRANGIEVTQL